MAKFERLYVLVLRDLKRSSPACQAGHAISEFLLRQGMSLWDNQVLVLLGISEQLELDTWLEVATAQALHVQCFREPDLNNQLTAFAACGEKAKEVFKDLPLL